MNDKNLFTLKEFLLANEQKKLSEVDYIHAIFKFNDLPIDVLFSFIKLLAPEFKVVDGHVFLNDFFDINTFKSYQLDGKNISEIQLWSNLIEITGVFEAMSESNALRLAKAIVDNWNVKLKGEALKGIGKARIIHDKEEAEVFITID